MKNFILPLFIIFILSSCSNTFKDKRDNKVYKTIKIGNKIWMTENLNFDLDDQGSYLYPNRMLNIDSSKLNEALDDYHIDKKSIIGLSGLDVLKKFNPYLNTIIKKYPEGWRYYTYDAAKKACPKGWRIPNNADWEELNSYLNTGVFDKIGLDSINYWEEYYRNPILEIRLGDHFGDHRGTAYWSSSETPEQLNICGIGSQRSFYINPLLKKTIRRNSAMGFCIRCVKDVE